MQRLQKVLGLLLLALLIVPAVPEQVFAATGIIYITPGSSSLQAGSSETLYLRINPGTTVDGVQATVSYNPSYLQLNSVDTSASPFNVQLQKSYGGGVINLSLGNLSGGVSSDSLVAAMNFTALAGSGSTPLSLSNANATSSGSYTNPSASGATLSFSSPVGSAPVSGGSSGSSGRNSNGYSYGAAPTASGSTAAGSPAAAAAGPTAAPAPAHLKSKINQLGYTWAAVKVTSDQNLDLFILYGTDANNLTNKSNVAAAATTVTLTLAKLIPGTPYYYQVVGQAPDGTQTKLPVQQLTTTGYTLRVTVLDEQNHALAHAKVTLHSRAQTVTADGKGVATFTGVTPGVHHIEYQIGSKNYSTPVYVENNVPKQLAAVVLPVQAPHSNVGALLVGLTITGLALVLMGWEIFRHEPEAKQAVLKLAMAARSWLF